MSPPPNYWAGYATARNYTITHTSSKSTLYTASTIVAVGYGMDLSGIQTNSTIPTTGLLVGSIRAISDAVTPWMLGNALPRIGARELRDGAHGLTAQLVRMVHAVCDIITLPGRRNTVPVTALEIVTWLTRGPQGWVSWTANLVRTI